MSGSIGAENQDEIDNAQEPFDPYTVKRVLIPRYSETGHRPNIPGYKCCTLWRGVYAQGSQATTAITHKSLPISPNTSEHKKDSKMSKMVTTVAPCNPFNQINKLDEIIATNKYVA
ncbi:uncharacterized protein C7orf72-like [Mizuhopecten yessoensis]|uniref:uncharacterized protein C7orf72-like n=1 Tax=Mizuhopecten yessoensis TaxID=6573 RepID=UPI000B459313|nr:uncharacterized protein C7orf72-like [Mizuhopecten yessoensis]